MSERTRVCGKCDNYDEQTRTCKPRCDVELNKLPDDWCGLDFSPRGGAGFVECISVGCKMAVAAPDLMCPECLRREPVW